MIKRCGEASPLLKHQSLITENCVKWTGPAPMDKQDQFLNPSGACRFDRVSSKTRTCRQPQSNATLSAMKTYRASMIIFAWLAIALSHDAMAADIARGKDISEQQCARCHVVGDFNPNGGISSTPSFQLLVKRRPDYRERFETFYARRPHPAFVIIEGVERLMPELPVNASPVTLPIEAVADIVAFVETLKPKQ